MKKPPQFDITLRDSIQPLLPSLTSTVPLSNSPPPPKGGSSRNKVVTKGSKPRGSKRKAEELVEDPMDEDIIATGTAMGVPPAENADP